MLGEKFQSPLRAKFRTLARRNGYPVALAESMVSAHLEIYEIKMADQTLYLNATDLEGMTADEQEKIIAKKVVVAKDELLTMDDAEARTLGFSMMTVSSIPDMLDRLNIKDYRITRLEPSWSETLGRFLTSIAPILMMIGMASLYAEYKVPGFGLPGLVGIICLGLVFGNQYIVGLADYTELILILLGLVLLGFEDDPFLSGFCSTRSKLAVATRHFARQPDQSPWLIYRGFCCRPGFLELFFPASG
jgi:membrane-bound serine protease (ClpP class)